MEYQYSQLVDPSTYETEGLCEGIPLRANYHPELEDLGALRAQEDWRRHVAPIGTYRGGLGPEYSFMTVAVPECIADRMEIISYANEFAFLHDGKRLGGLPLPTVHDLTRLRYHRHCKQG